ncbi:BMP family lipoprotein [Nocardia coubleae]|uniref:BMP family ABC transporter substrate-binding protein n=1 Tax=Nocardia coubleae TaxID=356147 RepID=A0A846W6M0_9NOCA|nr:BMP family ABC transporter substrate-binding protein [Nocardia coubleae]NKX88735.1 BMP family ABC transporter substrate-binding protein [Nocardia coubleae]
MRSGIALIAVVATCAATASLVGCGEPPAESRYTGSGNTYGSANAGFETCMVTDAGGVDDKSFNESGWNGVKAAIDANPGVYGSYRQSNSSADYEPNLRASADDDCDLVIGVGGLMAEAVAQVAGEYPDQRFAIVDAHVELDNVYSMEFNAAQSSYLAGYLAAGMTKTGRVATWGGMQIPAVTIFMDGFAAGVARYNQVHGTSTEVLGWNVADQNGSFTGNFDDTSAGRSLTENFIAQGADIIHPVAGPVGMGGASAVQDSPGVSMIWVDSDGYEAVPEYKDIMLSSSMKDISAAVRVAIDNAFAEGPKDGRYVGTLGNGGVGLAPFHDFDGAVPERLKQELTALRTEIVEGRIVIDSPAAPKL